MNHVRLSDQRRADLNTALRQFFFDEFDRELSEFQASRLIDFFLQRLAPQVYNQAIADARAFMSDRLDDLDAEFYEPEPER